MKQPLPIFNSEVTSPSRRKHYKSLPISLEMLQKDNYPSQAFAAGSYFAGAVLSGAFDQDQQKSRERDLVLRVSTINNFLGVDRLSLDAKQSHRGFSELNKKK